jgi:hypothetical protein
MLSKNSRDALPLLSAEHSAVLVSFKDGQK